MTPTYIAPIRCAALYLATIAAAVLKLVGVVAWPWAAIAAPLALGWLVREARDTFRK